MSEGNSFSAFAALRTGGGVFRSISTLALPDSWGVHHPKFVANATLIQASYPTPTSALDLYEAECANASLHLSSDPHEIEYGGVCGLRQDYASLLEQPDFGPVLQSIVFFADGNLGFSLTLSCHESRYELLMRESQDLSRILMITRLAL